MPDQESRRKAFRAAIATEGYSMQRWAAEYGISYTHLMMVLSGRRASHSLVVRIDEYIAAKLLPFALDYSEAAHAA